MNASTVPARGRHLPAPRSAVPEASRRLGRRAAVLGGSLAGLLSASVLARHFDEVVIVERDQLSIDQEGARRGVPQGRHSHGLLVSGSRAMERLLPGLSQDLIARGAILGDLLGRARWALGGSQLARFDSGMEGLLASRPLIEGEIRRHVLRLPNVVLLSGYDIAGLVASEDRRRVLGARVARRAPGTDHGSSSTELIQDGAVLADLVVDATGRGSRAATWLVELGYPAVQESVVDAGLTYVTRRFRQQPGVLDDLDADVVGADPQIARSGVALRQEDGSWTVTLAGGFGEKPPSELADFLTFARSLPTPGLAEIIAGCEPLGDPRTYHYPNSRWLHWEKLADRPECFTVIGDAVCSFNPVYGQGMSSAALQAEALGGVLDHGLAGLPARAAKSFARVVATPWALATGTDRRHVSQPTKPLPERLLDRYLDRLLAVAPHDREVTIAFNNVLNLLAAPASLLAPRVAARVLRPVRSRKNEAILQPIGH
jgi:2-polyprenyl-6-methoxyphenol hydroxylase-like FAD-dependent oxidoreductase